MKIAILTTYFFPEENGITRYIEGLYMALILKHPDIEVEVIAFDTLKTGKWFEKRGSFVIRRIESRQFLGGTYAIPTPRGYLQLRKIFAANTYDAINTHTRFFFSSFLGIRFGKKYGIPIVHTEHGSGFVQHGSFLVEIIAKMYDYTLGKYTIKNANVVCGVSQSVCTFAEKLGAKNPHTIYNGIKTSFWKEATLQDETRKELGILENDVVVSFVGRLVPSKGCQDIIAALNGVNVLNWKLIIIGDGPYRKKLEEIVEKNNLNGKVIFLGMQKKERIRSILQVCDLFVNPSFAAEGLPTTILEAAAAGCRCLSSDRGGAVEVLGSENTYPARDNEALREKIIRYKDIEKTDVDRFDWKNISERYFEVLKSV